ncbi:MAG: hypothetical protein ACYTGZ_02845 [Planctomycetota bacterium]|jgi:hypothetical protein
MHRAAAILLVISSSLMLGRAPCCSLHDFAGSVRVIASPAVQSQSERGGTEDRGPGEWVCPCCEKPHKHDVSQQEAPAASNGCDLPALIAALVKATDAPDAELALPIEFAALLTVIGREHVATPGDDSGAPMVAHAALNLPLLL